MSKFYKVKLAVLFIKTIMKAKVKPTSHDVWQHITVLCLFKYFSWWQQISMPLFFAIRLARILRGGKKPDIFNTTNLKYHLHLTYTAHRNGEKKNEAVTAATSVKTKTSPQSLCYK